ncbi:MAG: hypothetical protein AAGG08_17055, partial [Actinomycetota bacterium]
MTSLDASATSAPEAVIEHLAPTADIIVPLANGEPTALLDSIENAVASEPARFERLRVHQMHALHDRPYLR